MNVAGYIRVSSIEQVNGTSLDTQADRIAGYCQSRGMDIVAMFQDNGVSGGMPLADRPEGAKLVALVEADGIDAVVIMKLDRGFRNVADCLKTVDAWEAKGVALHVVDLGGNSIDTVSTMGRFMLTVLAAAAEMERGMIKDRCNAGRAARKAEGKRIGEVPFGYDLAADNTLVPNPQEHAAIEEMKSLKAEGHSLRGIAAYLIDKGVSTKKGGRWSAQGVKSILMRAA
jgi:site-specific DNA recombinase